MEQVVVTFADWFWNEFGGPEVENIEFLCGSGKIWESPRLKSLIFLQFSNDFGGPEAETFDVPSVLERFWSA